MSQAELVVIDEAAAIPLPLVKKLLGPYLVFMASTINGYEGTGRSLSLKLLEQLRQQSNRLAVTANDGGSATRTLHECELKVKRLIEEGGFEVDNPFFISDLKRLSFKN